MILTRYKACSEGIFGELSIGEDRHVACTLEHAYEAVDADGVVHWSPKLPDGEYTCVFGDHMLHSGPIKTFEITGVPGHQGILFHSGNTEGDSEGCVLLGTTVQGNSILESKKALGVFLGIQLGLQQFSLTVRTTQET